MYERIVPRSSTSYSQKLINQKTMNSHANAYERKAERLLPARSWAKKRIQRFTQKDFPTLRFLREGGNWVSKMLRHIYSLLVRQF